MEEIKRREISDKWIEQIKQQYIDNLTDKTIRDELRLEEERNIQEEILRRAEKK